MPLAIAALCVEFPQTTSPGNHEQCREKFHDKRQWRQLEQPLSYHMHVETITFYLSLTLCGQLGSSNRSALFIHCHY